LRATANRLACSRMPSHVSARSPACTHRLLGPKPPDSPKP
jgi:hypothetical protein